MKLTIGMIVKNEEKWLDKCLSAIKSILDNVDCELIITDTGSTDRTVEIARKYTDKVLHFDWIGDFAAARNYGLEKAQGEWFMMLDADDIFESCDHVINFFNSGEYRKYNSASYISRNLSNNENGGTTYSDFLVPRMTMLHHETRYTGLVHEYLTTFGAPIKKIEDIAVHYGYLYENEGDMMNKFQRNTELLLRRYKTETDPDPMLFVQLFQSYMTIKDSKNAYRYLDEGIEFAKSQSSITLAALYFHKAGALQTEHLFEDAISVCDEYFRMDKKIRKERLWADGEIHGIKAQCLFEMKKYVEAVSEFHAFFEIYKDIASGKLMTYDAHLIGSYMTNEINIMPLFNNLIDSCIKSGKLNTADLYLSTFPIHKYSLETKKISELVSLIIQVTNTFGTQNIKKYYAQLDSSGKKMLSDEMLYCILNNNSHYLKPLEDIAKQSERIKQKLHIYKAHLDHKDITEEVNEYVSEYGVNEDIDLIYIMLLDKCDISGLLGLPDTDMKKFVYLCCRNIDGFYEAAENYPADLIKNTDKAEDAEKFYDYCISMKLLDNENKTKEEKELLVSGLFKVKKELTARTLNNGNRNANNEFDKLALQIKSNIRKLIASGNIDTARKTLTEYQKLKPGDNEISELAALLEGQQNE